jgi:hypothetical protein
VLVLRCAGLGMPTWGASAHAAMQRLYADSAFKPTLMQHTQQTHSTDAALTQG